MTIPEFKKTTSQNSTYTNFTILNENWIKLKNFLQLIVEKINTIVDSDVNNVYEELMKRRINLNIVIANFVSNELNLSFNDVNYKVIKSDDNKSYTITKSGNGVIPWDMTLNTIQIKNKDSVIIYPYIQTIDNKIVVKFDNIDDSFSVLVI